MLERIRQMALDSGMYQAEYLNADQIKCYPEVRKTCEGNGCGNYNNGGCGCDNNCGCC